MRSSAHFAQVTRKNDLRTTRAPAFVLLGAALSIDNVAIGFALGTYRVNVLAAALVIGAVSVALTLTGLEVGSRLGERLGERAEYVGGAVLILIGLLIATGAL
jgi:putative Mn2+ efflux pump MntP